MERVRTRALRGQVALALLTLLSIGREPPSSLPVTAMVEQEPKAANALNVPRAAEAPNCRTAA
jgi:hypothetical protein